MVENNHDASARGKRSSAVGGSRRRVTTHFGPRPATPTPDNGVRYSDVRVWDEDNRPTGPAPDPGRRYSKYGHLTSQHLVDVHDQLRAELAELRELMRHVIEGNLTPGAMRSRINKMSVRQHSWNLGAYCASYCRVVTNHHQIEDYSVFPHLRRADTRLRPVIDRLDEEHDAIHEVVVGLDKAVVAFANDPAKFEELRASIDLLTDTLLSHLSYEERELLEPIARLGLHS